MVATPAAAIRFMFVRKISRWPAGEPSPEGARLLGMNGPSGPINSGREYPMTKFTKIAAGTLAALTITVGALATSSTEAHAWGKKGWGPGIGFGIAAGVIGAAAYAATA